MDVEASRLKTRGTVHPCYQYTVKKPAYWICSLHTWKSIIDGERDVQVFEQFRAPSSKWHLLQGRPCMFQQENSKPNTEAMVLKEKNWCIIKWKIQQRITRNAEQIKSSIIQVIGQNSSPTSPAAGFLGLQMSLKKAGMLHSCKRGSLLYWEVLPPSYSMSQYFSQNGTSTSVVSCE